jgi:hypothetical protein
MDEVGNQIWAINIGMESKMYGYFKINFRNKTTKSKVTNRPKKTEFN